MTSFRFSSKHSNEKQIVLFDIWKLQLHLTFTYLVAGTECGLINHHYVMCTVCCCRASWIWQIWSSAQNYSHRHVCIFMERHACWRTSKLLITPPSLPLALLPLVARYPLCYVNHLWFDTASHKSSLVDRIRERSYFLIRKSCFIMSRDRTEVMEQALICTLQPTKGYYWWYLT